MRGVNAAEQLLEFIVSDCFLKFRQRFPVGRAGERIAEMIDGESGGEGDEDEDEGEEDSEMRKAKDHGLEFRLFNTMLGEC
jgi:hypothetical protein